MKKALANFFEIGHIENNPEQNYITTIFNQAAGLAIISDIIIILVILFLVPAPTSESGLIIPTLILTISLFVISLVFNYFKKIYLGRALLLFTVCTSISLSQVITGDYFFQNGVILSALAGTHLALINRPGYRRISYILIIGTYFASILYVNLYLGNINMKEDFPYATILFLGATVYAMNKLYDFFQTNQKKATKDLIKKNIALKQTTNDMERFTYIASHDLKAPLVNIKVLLDIIEKEVKTGSTDATLEKLTYVNESTDKMNALIEGVLNLSDIEKKLASLEYQSVNLDSVVNEIKKELAERLDEKNAKIIVEPLPKIHTNIECIKIVFKNLIENAIIYNTNSSPEVRITHQKNKNNFIFKIQDNGIGISDKDCQEIFQPFKRLDVKNSYKGVGLGLSISKKIIDTFQGEIKFESNPHSGSTVIVQLPKGSTT